MADIHAQTDTWLGRAKAWQEALNHVEVIADQNTHIPALTTYLKQLHGRLKKFVSVAEAMHSLPKMGQLLGRLTSQPRLLLEPALHEALTSCVLYFYVQHPASPVEARSKAWALSQIRSMVGQVRGCDKETLVINVTGHTLSDFYKQCAYVTCAELEAGTPSRLPPEPAGLCALARTCLSLRHVGPLDSLLYHSLSRLAELSSRSAEAEGILAEVIASQRHPYTDGNTVKLLPYKVQLLLWDTSLDALEHELLDLVERSSRESRQGLQDLIQKRHLAMACARSPHIHQVVFDVLRDLCQTSGGHWKLLYLTNVLHKCVRSNMADQMELTISVMSQYESPFHSLVSLLSVDPTDLSAECLNHQMAVLESHLQDLHVVGGSEVFKETAHILTHFLEWYNTALCHSLTGPQTVLKSCVTVLLVHHPSEASSLDDILDIVESLRGLLDKASLTMTDIRCALAAKNSLHCTQSQGSKVMGSLPAQLVLVFTVLSAAGCRLVTDILHMVMSTESGDDERSEALENALEIVQSISPLSTEKIEMIRNSLKR